ncbi:hypothetical protein LOTGIDRAFT_113008 [Lottia gigantea]|uniref:FCH and double SH3 domains protein 2 n=1 Tax=Lottia gigantea TaxID=225164 RepID=V4ARU7_LOTGI|nr:hypothetical protein LOTGIDRAFT_113008 [Lottia gigantea]ESO99967.1 hypothetical protein LOTGIDRAFT_113008 [Lottia gigantea]
MLPPPRKVKPSVQLKAVHSEQVSKLQAKHQQECDLLEDLRTYCQKRSALEKEYAQGLLKLANQLLKREFPSQPDSVSSEDGREHKTACTVWHTILEETEKLAKARLQAAEIYSDKIAEPVKPLRSSKVHCMKKVMPQLTTIQSELSHSVSEMVKSQKLYNTEESLSHEARQKSAEADDKKSTGIFQSLASLQKTSAKLKSRREACEIRSTACRNDHILNLSAANAHQIRYYSTDLPELLQILDGEVYEKIEEYFSLIGHTAADVSQSETESFRNIVTQAEKISRQYSLQCFLYQYPVFTNLLQYQFEPCHQDPITKVSGDYNAAPDLEKEAKKWAARVAKETKLIRDYTRSLKIIQSAGSSERVNPEQKLEELKQNIRKAEVKLLFFLIFIDIGIQIIGVCRYTWFINSMFEMLMQTVISRTDLLECEEPTYTHYDDDDDFIDDTFNTSADNEAVFTHSSGTQYPLKCRALYAFDASNYDELTIQADEELELVANGDGDGWVKARNKEGKSGYIPENYVDVNNTGVKTPPTGSVTSETEVQSEPPTPVATQPPDVQSPVTEIQHETTSSYSSDIWVRALYDYEGQTAEELQFQEGALIKLLRKDHGVDDGFWEGEINGKVGLFPSLVVEEISQDGISFDVSRYS